MAPWQRLAEPSSGSGSRSGLVQWCGVPFGAGYRAISYAYRHQSQDFVVADLRSLLDLPESWGASAGRLKLSEALLGTRAQRSSISGERLVAALDSVWGRTLLEIAALEFLDALFQVAVAILFLWVLQDLERGAAAGPPSGEAGAEASQFVAVRAALLALAAVLSRLAQQCAAHWRVRLAAQAEAALRACVFRHFADDAQPDGEALRSLISPLPQLTSAWSSRSLHSAVARILATVLAVAALLYTGGPVGLAAPVAAAGVVGLEALVVRRVLPKSKLRVREAKARREAAAKELLETISLVKSFAWERLYFRRLGVLRDAEREALGREAGIASWVAALRVDLLMLVQGAAIALVLFLPGGSMSLASMFSSLVACRVLGEQLREFRDIVVSPRPVTLAGPVEAALLSPISKPEPPSQGDQVTYSKSKHALSIEGMRFFWEDKTGSPPGPPVAKPAAAAPASEPPEASGPAPTTAAASAWGPPAKASAVVSSVNPADFMDAATSAGGGAQGDDPAAASASTFPAASPHRAAAPAPAKTGWDLVDQVTDEGSVAERAARAAGGKTGFDLKVLCFQIKRGSLVALVGATGCGKSTLFAALRGICKQELWGDDAEGTGITISGRLAFVPQVPMLLAKCSVRDNVLCGLPLDTPKYDKAMSMSTLADEVAALPDGDASDISELTDEGSRMCVQLARAFYHEAEIVLLDDPFVAMDPARASRIVSKGLKKLAKERTVILGTQNLSLLSGIQQIIVLRNGTVFEQGDYKTLTAMPTEFSRMLLIANKKDAARALQRRRLVTGAPCPYICYELDADPMDEVFPMDREFQAGGFALAQDAKWKSQNTGGSDLWLSAKGNAALAAAQAPAKGPAPWDTQWSARGETAGGVTVRDGKFRTIESTGTTPRPESARSQGSGGNLHQAPNRSTPRNQRERLGGAQDRRRGFAFEAPEFQDVQDYFDSLGSGERDRPLSGPPGAGQRPGKPAQAETPKKAHGIQKESALIAQEVDFADWRPEGKAVQLGGEVKEKDADEADDRREVSSGKEEKAPKHNDQERQLQGLGAATGGRSPGITAWLVLQGGGLSLWLLSFVIMSSVAANLGVQYALGHLLAGRVAFAESADPLLPSVLSDGSMPAGDGGSDDADIGSVTEGTSGGSGNSNGGAATSTQPPDPTVADSGSGGIIDDEGVLWRGFGDYATTTAYPPTTTLPPPTTPPTTTTEVPISSMEWVSIVAGKFCSEKDTSLGSTPGASFECDGNGCYKKDMVTLTDCERSCESLAGWWGCRFISWGGPVGSERYCYVLRTCTEFFLLPAYQTQELNVTFGLPGRRLLLHPRHLQSGNTSTSADGFDIEDVTQKYLVIILVALCVLLAVLALGQARLSATVAIAAGHEASTRQLRAVLATSTAALTDPSVPVHRQLLEDVADVDGNLPQELPRFLGMLVHVLACAAAVALIGAQQVILAVALAVVLGVTSYLHVLRLPLLRHLRRLRTSTEDNAMLRTTHLQECHELLRVHGRLQALCDDFEALSGDVAETAVMYDLAERWLYTRLHCLNALLQGLLAFALLSQASAVASELGLAAAAVALLQTTLLPEPMLVMLKTGAAVHHGLAALRRMRQFWHNLSPEELDSPALRMRAPTARELKEAEQGFAALKARNDHRVVLGDSVIERGSDQERAFAMFDLARLEREQGISVGGFELEQVSDDWPYFGAVELEKVTLTYSPGAGPALQDVTLELQGSKSMLVVGPQKSGKTSLMRAILRLWPVETGSIVVDCVDVRSVGLTTLRSRIAYVPQETTLFRGTWRENLDPMAEFDEEQLSLAIRMTRLSNWLDRHAPRGLDEPLPAAQGGKSSLTSELKCLLGVSRALLRLLQRRSKLLLLDAATCRLGPASDADLTVLLLRYCQRREVAVLQTSRRVTQAPLYDSAAVMQSGRLMEHGPVKKLWAKDGAFRAAARAQGVDSASLAKAEAVADRMTSVWAWDMSPQEDSAWSDEFAVGMKKMKRDKKRD